MDLSSCQRDLFKDHSLLLTNDTDNQELTLSREVLIQWQKLDGLQKS